MNHSPNTDSRSNFILALWGLLFTKCFTLEYLVRHYEAPINSLSYVWALSIIMAGVATLVYANIQSEERTKQLEHPNFLVVFALAIFIVILVVKSLLATDGIRHTLALAAVGLSIIQLLINGKALKARVIGISLGWFLAAALIFIAAQPLSFLVFAVSICMLSFLPRAIQFVALRRGKVHSQAS